MPNLCAEGPLFENEVSVYVLSLSYSMTEVGDWYQALMTYLITVPLGLKVLSLMVGISCSRSHILIDESAPPERSLRR
jgi:hypothetical protein